MIPIHPYYAFVVLDWLPIEGNHYWLARMAWTCEL